MYKKLLVILLSMFSFFSFFGWIKLSYAESSDKQPTINCAWLPWCKWQSVKSLDNWTSVDIWQKFVLNIINQFIQLVAVAAVFSLIFSWILYLISMWDDAKVKQAKNWIIYSLIWVLVSVSAWWIINLINNFRIN